MENKVTLWAARDRDGNLYGHERYPFRSLYFFGFWGSVDEDSFKLPKTMLPELNWEDEPIEIELTIKRK